MFPRIKIFCDKFPYITQGLIAAVLQTTGDLISQKLIEKKETLDVKRTRNFFIVGFFTGVILRKWYGVLDSSFQHPKKFANAVSKVGANQFLFTPIFLFVSTGFVGFLQDGSLKDAREMVKKELADILIADAKVRTEGS